MPKGKINKYNKNASDQPIEEEQFDDAKTGKSTSLQTPTDNCYKLEASTFRLFVSFSEPENWLSIRIEDVKDWVIYSQ